VIVSEGCTTVVAAMVLAAAGGQRFGGPKALLQVNGLRLIEHALSAAREAKCAPIVAVLGSEPARVRAEVDLDGVQVVENANWRSGAGSSVRAGLQALADTGEPVAAAVLLLVDTPGVSAEAVRRLCEGAEEGTLRAATYGGRRGYPVLVGREHWAGMSVLASSDVGARAYLTAHADLVVPVNCEDVADGAEYDIPVGS
jgi:CTP:molybdopterin cytidylyltransferase MocA